MCPLFTPRAALKLTAQKVLGGQWLGCIHNGVRTAQSEVARQITISHVLSPVLPGVLSSWSDEAARVHADTLCLHFCHKRSDPHRSRHSCRKAPPPFPGTFWLITENKLRQPPRLCCDHVGPTAGCTRRPLLWVLCLPWAPHSWWAGMPVILPVYSPQDLASSSAHLEGPESSEFNSTDLPGGEALGPPPGLQVH